MSTQFYKYAINFVLLVFINLNALAQDKKQDSIVKTTDSIKPNWHIVNKAGLDISQLAFVNWNSGGTNSISGLLALDFKRNYQKDNLIWENSAIVRYGINKQEGRDLRKTDDLIEVNSTFGFRKDTISNWYYSANFNFKTQFTNGYNYANSETEPISRLFAPAYVFLGIGAVYGENIDSFSAYMSPLTLKSTLVLDQSLADQGAFGVKKAIFDDQGNRIEKGDKTRRELGILLTGNFEKKVAKNIELQTFLNLYTDYLNDFGNIDVDWRVNFIFTVNSFVRATLGSHIKYDNDIKIAKDTESEEETEFLGAKVQWKQLLGIGVVIDF